MVPARSGRRCRRQCRKKGPTLPIRLVFIRKDPERCRPCCDSGQAICPLVDPCRAPTGILCPSGMESLRPVARLPQSLRPRARPIRQHRVAFKGFCPSVDPCRASTGILCHGGMESLRPVARLPQSLHPRARPIPQHRVAFKGCGRNRRSRTIFRRRRRPPSKSRRRDRRRTPHLGPRMSAARNFRLHRSRTGQRFRHRRLTVRHRQLTVRRSRTGQRFRHRRLTVRRSRTRQRFRHRRFTVRHRRLTVLRRPRPSVPRLRCPHASRPLPRRPFIGHRQPLFVRRGHHRRLPMLQRRAHPS